MTGVERVGAGLLHPVGDALGNILWPGTLPEAQETGLNVAIAAISAKGYFASAFPEGDGLCFKRDDGADYDPETAFDDFQAAFSFLALELLDPRNPSMSLAHLAGDRTVACTCLVPVEGLRLEAPFGLGQTRFHAPVDGEDIALADHAWSELCEVPGADVTPSWAPDGRASGTTGLLAHALIERTVELPLSAFYAAEGSFDGQSALLRIVMEDADHALDPIRFDLCHFARLECLPAKPGWVGEFALAHIKPVGKTPKPRTLGGKPYVLRVMNNWLGLEVESGHLGMAQPLSDLVVDTVDADEITLALKGALRAWNRSFYLVDLEASFLHLVYAIDALCDPGRLVGDRQRLWVTAYASTGDAADFSVRLATFDQHYSVRNKIVHSGESFASLGLNGEEQCDFMLRTLGSCIRTIMFAGFSDRQGAAQFAFDRLTSPELAAVTRFGKVTGPVASDKAFLRHMAELPPATPSG